MFPASRLITIAGIVVGFAVLGFCHAVIREAGDYSLRDRDGVRRATGFDRVTEVPMIKARSYGAPVGHDAALQSSYSRLVPEIATAIGRVAIRLEGGPERRKVLVVGVGGAEAGAGVSTIAAHFARICAEAGRTTLLIDANWQRGPLAASGSGPVESGQLAPSRREILLEKGRVEVLLLRPVGEIFCLNASLSISTVLDAVRCQYDTVVVDFHSHEQSGDLEANLSLIDDVIVVADARRTRSDDLCDFLGRIPTRKVAAIVLNRRYQRSSRSRAPGQGHD